MNTGALEKNTPKTQLRRAVLVGGVLCALIGIITLLTSLSGLFRILAKFPLCRFYSARYPLCLAENQQQRY